MDGNNNIRKVEKRKIVISDTISYALKKMDSEGVKLLFVFDENRFESLLSIGDIQRAIINNFPLETKVSAVLRKEIDFATIDERVESIKSRMLMGRAELMPVLDEKGQLVDVVFWEDIFPERAIPKDKINLPVVIMAGGKGTRLKPLTNIIPKPLIPIGDKSIIEDIIDNFVEIGCERFYISVNYKAEAVKHHFSQIESKRYEVVFFQEKRPLGTAGSLHLIKGEINTPFFVSNCDIVINEDYSEIVKYHQRNKNELTIVSALKSFSIPYGIIETQQNGELTAITEKPELNFQINSGMYLLEPNLLNEIPENTFFHITDLIEKIRDRGGKVGVFPVSEKSWVDIGDWQEYLKNINLKKSNYENK